MQLDHKLEHDGSVLAIAISKDNIYAGTHDGEIFVWSLDTFQPSKRIQAHKKSVMCLFLPHDQTLLFSSASGPIVNVWNPRTMDRLYEIYSTHDSFGDIYSVAYSTIHDTVYFGCQNTSIQWIRLNDTCRRVSHDSPEHPDRRNHRFFDSRAVGGASTPRPTDCRQALIPPSHAVLEVDRRCYKLFAHHGFVFAMLLAKGCTSLTDPDAEVLISASGAGSIKVWKLGGQGVGPKGVDNGLQEIMQLGDDDMESVYSLAIDGSFLYAGRKKGVVELWDLDTKQKLRRIKAHDDDIMALQLGWGYLWTTGANGTASKYSTVHYGKYQSDPSQKVSERYKCLVQWQAHDAKILASAATVHQGTKYFITGANDNNIAVWHVDIPCASDETDPEINEDAMTSSLREFVSYKTVSSRPEFAEDCRQGATFLRTLFQKLGADVAMLSANDSHHPVVFAKFTGKGEPHESRKRILFYGHYDVVGADRAKGNWTHDPFQLKGTNGYLYGRGVSDNKGPVMAALYAVTDLMQAKCLDSDIVFLIEGEEESHSRGFQETVRKHKDRIGHIDYILLANSYWLNDQTPCLTYGLRGVLHAVVCVESDMPDLHSGVDGSSLAHEPLADLVHLTSKLKTPVNKVLIPGFYEGILPLSPEEEARYDDIMTVLIDQNKDASAPSLKSMLISRWREPNLTTHKFKSNGADGSSVVGSHASAHISIRLVPGQEVDTVSRALIDYVEALFAELGSPHRLSVKINNKAEPWLGDPDNYVFRTLEEAIVDVWKPLFDEGDTDGIDHMNGTTDSNGANVTCGDGGADPKSTHAVDGCNGINLRALQRPRRPLFIREGGSIPAIRFLEKEFDAPAAHLPIGQASDSAHLDNERLKIVNLVKGRQIFGRVFRKL